MNQRRPRPPVPAWARSVWAGLRRDDRGSNVVELAILAPGFLAIIMLIVQFALWFNARQAALASAQAGAQVAREDAATNGDWPALAQQASANHYTSLNTRPVRR